MLFAAKRHATWSLGLAVAFVVVSLVARRALGLGWSLEVDGPVLFAVGGGLLAVFLSDALVHGVLLVTAGDDYRRTFGALVEYYRNQSTAAVLAGGLLAGSEELLFRGVVLLGLVQVASVPVLLAVVVAAVSFGVAHYVEAPRFRPMVLWATLEGLLLGGLLVATGSLLVPVVVHALHDVAGFWLFSWLRGRDGSER